MCVPVCDVWCVWHGCSSASLVCTLTHAIYVQILLFTLLATARNKQQETHRHQSLTTINHKQSTRVHVHGKKASEGGEEREKQQIKGLETYCQAKLIIRGWLKVVECH